MKRILYYQLMDDWRGALFFYWLVRVNSDVKLESVMCCF